MGREEGPGIAGAGGLEKAFRGAPGAAVLVGPSYAEGTVLGVEF